MEGGANREFHPQGITSPLWDIMKIMSRGNTYIGPEECDFNSNAL
jgi:hypothetical protein